LKYKDWLTDWLENIVKPTAKMRTYARYSELINRHIILKIGEYEINDLSPLLLQRFVTDLLQNGNLVTGNGLSPSTVNSIVTILQNSLKSAYVFGKADEYKAERIKRPKSNETEVVSFTKFEQKQIEQAVFTSGKDKLFGIILCLYTGLRIGELLALEWIDVDFAKGLLKITKSCHYGKNASGKFERQTDTPKTRTSRRIIPLPKQILVTLKTIKKQSNSKYIISNGCNPISVRSYQRSFALLLQKSNIQHKGFHALRHTFATRALECGMDVKTLSEILGHKNASITLNRYVHSLLEHKQEMMNKVGKLLQ